MKNSFLSKKKIWIAGHDGMVGSAILRNLKKKKLEILTVSKKKLDLRIQSDVENWIKKKKTRCNIFSSRKSWRDFGK